jgi:mRNA interferase HigB
LEIINSAELRKFGKKHPDARKPLSRWEKMTAVAHWASFRDLRATFSSADYVKGLVIFDIGGNNYRVIARVDHGGERVYVLAVLTHSEYDRWKP